MKASSCAPHAFKAGIQFATFAEVFAILRDLKNLGLLPPTSNRDRRNAARIISCTYRAAVRVVESLWPMIIQNNGGLSQREIYLDN